MRIRDFDYQLPEAQIAQRPLEERDASRLLVMSKTAGTFAEHIFRDLPTVLHGNELLVLNNARVIPARLFGYRRGLGSQAPGKGLRLRREHLSSRIEVLLTRKTGEDTWEALVRPGRKVASGEQIVFGQGELECEVLSRGEYGVRVLRFRAGQGTVGEALKRIGHVPLPPYIRRSDDPADAERYQTVYAKSGQAVAAPTAGLHFTASMLEELRRQGLEICELTLEVGLGTFQPVRVDQVEHHALHAEAYEIPLETAERVRAAKSRGRPVLAVGTTVVRALEDAAIKAQGSREILRVGRAQAEIFIYPGFAFHIVDQLLTNFHLPRSTLLVLVSAFAGRTRLLAAYHHALQRGYRFYSYGDCMLIR
jgi:S-adenosylmethionine:tRNA ribosyltransferase-isomerase